MRKLLFNRLCIIGVAIFLISCSKEDFKNDLNNFYFEGDWDVDVTNVIYTINDSGQFDTTKDLSYKLDLRLFPFGGGIEFGRLFADRDINWSYDQINDRFIYVKRFEEDRGFFEVRTMDIVLCEEDEFMSEDVVEFINEDGSITTEYYSQHYLIKI